ERKSCGLGNTSGNVAVVEAVGRPCSSSGILPLVSTSSTDTPALMLFDFLDDSKLRPRLNTFSRLVRNFRVGEDGLALPAMAELCSIADGRLVKFGAPVKGRPI